MSLELRTWFLQGADMSGLNKRTQWDECSINRWRRRTPGVGIRCCRLQRWLSTGPGSTRLRDRCRWSHGTELPESNRMSDISWQWAEKPPALFESVVSMVGPAIVKSIMPRRANATGRMKERIGAKSCGCTSTYYILWQRRTTSRFTRTAVVVEQAPAAEPRVCLKKLIRPILKRRWISWWNIVLVSRRSP